MIFPPGSSVIAYLRDSGGDSQDLSTAQQESAIRAWCAENHFELSLIYRDEAAPGSSVIARTGFLEMIAYLTSKTSPTIVSGVIVWKFSRFAREIDDSQYYKSSLRRMGYTIHSLNENIPAGLDGRLFEAALDWMNARYLKDLSEDVRRGLRHNMLQHGAIGGVPPRGFVRGEPIHLGTRRNGQPHIVHRWIPDPDLADMVRLAFQLRASGHSYAEITKETGLYRSKASWMHFFANEIYRGVMRYGGQVIENYCGRLVDDITWHTVQEINSRSVKKGNLEMKDNPRAKTSSYMLTGLLKCADCGAPMTGNTIAIPRKNWTGHYYACQHKCGARNIPQDIIERAVLHDLFQSILTPENLREKRAELADAHPDWAGDLRTKLQKLARQHTTMSLQISRLTDAIAAAGHSTALLEKLRQVEGEAAHLKRQISETENQIAEASQLTSDADLEAMIAGLRAQLDSNRAAQRKIIHGLVHEIRAKRTDGKITGEIVYYLPSMYSGLSHRSAYTRRHRLSVTLPG